MASKVVDPVVGIRRQTDLRHPPPHVLWFGSNSDTPPSLQHRSRYQVVTRVTPRDLSLRDAPAIADHVFRAVKPNRNIGMRLFDRRWRQPADLSHITGYAYPTGISEAGAEVYRQKRRCLCLMPSKTPIPPHERNLVVAASVFGAGFIVTMVQVLARLNSHHQPSALEWVLILVTAGGALASTYLALKDRLAR